MPWTMTLESLVRKIAMCQAPAFASSCGLVGPVVHGLGQRHQRMGRVGEDPPALLDVVAVQPYDERLGRLVAQDPQCRNDSVGHGVARRDAAEHVDEDRPARPGRTG